MFGIHSELSLPRLTRSGRGRAEVVLWLWLEQLLQDVSAGTNPTVQKPGSSVIDENLMFEFLLSGVKMDQDNNIILTDAELASMRPGRAFLTRINDGIPRSRSSMLQMATTLEGARGRPLSRAQFEGLLLSLVYSAHRAAHQEAEEKREAWAAVLLQLANVTVHQLRGSHLFSYA